MTDAKLTRFGTAVVKAVTVPIVAEVKKFVPSVRLGFWP
jgi:hypothetical protein